MEMEDRIKLLEDRVAVIEKAISKETKLKDFEDSFGTSPKPLEYTGKIAMPTANDKFTFGDFRPLGGRVADYSLGLPAKFVPDNPNIKALPEWYSSIDGRLGEGTETTLLARTPERHIIVVKYKGKVLDYVGIDSELVDCSKCGG